MPHGFALPRSFYYGFHHLPSETIRTSQKVHWALSNDHEGDQPATKLKLQHKKVIKYYCSSQEALLTAGCSLGCSGLGSL